MATPEGLILLLFAHTSEGNAALAGLLEAGVSHEAIRVAGDLGPAVSQPGAERHATLDALHVPAPERQIFMDTIRAGGVVLAVDASIVDTAFVEHLQQKHSAMRITRTSGDGAHGSHNAA